MKKIVTLFLLFILLLSCEKEANVKLPEVKSQPVISSYLSLEDTIHRIRLTASQPLYEAASTFPGMPIEDASVSITGPGGNASFNYNPTDGYYELKSVQYPLQAGGNYQVKVKLKNGTEATAETTVPHQTVQILDASVIKMTSNNGVFFKVKFQDDPNRLNYYRFSLNIIRVTPSNDTIYVDPGINVMHSDISNNGATIELGTNYYNSEGDYGIGYEFYVLNISESYFKFYKSLENYTGDNPFSEPALIYTNVKNGLGVFGAYRSSKKVIWN